MMIMTAMGRIAALVWMPLSAVLLLSAGCSSNTDAGTGVQGTEGRERWVVTFGGAEPDLTEYRALAQTSADDAEAYADRMRKKLLKDHAAFDGSLQAVNGRIVEAWWMSNAVTVEVERHAVPTLRGAPGVSSISPDVALDN